MKRHLLEPLVVNFGAATAMRLLVPYTLVDSGERFRYVTMSPRCSDVPLRSRDPAAFRFEYTMSADGHAFLANAIDDPPAPISISAIRNWAAAVFR